MSTICSAWPIAFLIDCTVLSISTIAPFRIPSDLAVPTPIILMEPFNTSPIMTFISDVPISKLLKFLHYSFTRHLQSQPIISSLYFRNIFQHPYARSLFLSDLIVQLSTDNFSFYRRNHVMWHLQ